MKKIFSLMAVVLAAATVFTSCKKDDEGSYPTKLDGFYAAVNSQSVAFQFFYVYEFENKKYAEFAFYESTFDKVKDIRGPFEYDASTGKGYIVPEDDEELNVDVQATKGSTNVTVTCDGKSYILTLLEKAGFEAGYWTGTGSTSGEHPTPWSATLDVDNAATGSMTISYNPGEVITLNYDLNSIFGFYKIAEGTTVGVLRFVNAGADQQTYIPFFGIRMDATSKLVLVDEGGDVYKLTKGTKPAQVTSALAE